MFSLGTVAVHRQAWDGTISISPESDVTSTEVQRKILCPAPTEQSLSTCFMALGWGSVGEGRLWATRLMLLS